VPIKIQGAAVTKVIWRMKPDQDDVIWHDLLDPSRGKGWFVTFTQKGNAWLVMRRDSPRDELIPTKDITEKQLREQLRLQYLLTRGEI
jgi:hypothetical protein